ncbi:pneumococcal serine-rich repeat protein-like [Haliotis rufescens]|uniref:pneumococcal serine-rich repeat protein-like n=1 Tax=Haliotis rufescens TaxID=6454 RepID=UPI001EAFC7B3|nr:pneumococcal serine-rich repeat protein-like [Haliotis rufescens]
MYALAFCVLVSSVVGLPHYNGNIRSDTEFVTIRHLHSEHDRTKRDTSGMPDRIVLSFELSTGSMVFNLTKSERDHHDIPVVVRRGEMAFNRDVQKNYDQAIYKDQSQNAALMVEKIATGDYKVAGLFHIGETPYDIWPEHRHKRSVRSVVSAVLNIDFTADSVRNDVYWKRKPEFDRQMELLKSSQGRQKRSNVQQHILELCFFSDSADWNMFLTNAGGNAVQAEADLRLYYFFIEQAMNVRYANLPPNQVCVQVQVKGITIFMTANTPSWVFNFVNAGGNIDVSGGIREMSGETPGTTGAAADQGTACDHFMLFSGRNLFGNNTGTLIDINGLALQGAACSRLSVSMIENDKDGSVCLVASHELGHSLNAEHDIDAGCNDADGFIMATRFSAPAVPNPGNFFRFSTCSAVTFTAFFNSLNTRNTNCALVANVPGGPVLTNNGSIAGQLTDADAQCARFMPGTRFCRLTAAFLGIDAICQRIACGANTAPGGICQFMVPLDRTSCGNQRWCVQGQCVTDNAAPARAVNCPQGDDPGVACTPALCVTEPVRCCQTCGVVPTTATATTATTTTATATTATTTTATSTTATTTTVTTATATTTTATATTATTTTATSTTATTTTVTTATATTTTATATATTVITTSTATSTTAATTTGTTVAAGTVLSVRNLFILSC